MGFLTRAGTAVPNIRRRTRRASRVEAEASDSGSRCHRAIFATPRHERAASRCCIGATRQKITYPRSFQRIYHVRRLAHRGRRRSRRRMTERGAAPDNGVAVEPREAQRPTSLAARTPQAATPGNGNPPWVRRRASQACLKGGVAHRSGASRRSIPSLRGTEKWADAPASQRTGAAERWLNDCHAWMTAAHSMDGKRRRHG